MDGQSEYKDTIKIICLTCFVFVFSIEFTKRKYASFFSFFFIIVNILANNIENKGLSANYGKI